MYVFGGINRKVSAVKEDQMKKRRVLSVVLAASMFAMLLTGCGGGNQGSAEGSQAAAIGQGVAEAESCIKIGVSGTPDLDPAIVNTGSSLIAAINIYDIIPVK